MSNTDSVGAVFGLLLGLAAQSNPLVGTANASPSGPVAAIEKARTAAAAESQRARSTDGEAAHVFATEPEHDTAAGTTSHDPKPVAAGTASHDAKPTDAAAGDAVAARGPADAAAPAGAAGPYDPARHRDPFRPPNLTPQVAADKGTPRTPLEAYEIGQLKLVGIVQDGGSTRAMVEDSAGLGYIVTAGTPIGSSGGVVRAIEQRRVLISETKTDFYGEKQAKEVVMELPQEDRSP